MQIAIVQFPGSNCERETALAVRRAGMVPVDFLWNESPEILQDMDGYVIVGGFSYEDRSRAGIIAALDPVMKEIARQSEQGKPVLGICNGAQILVETGLVPGLKNNQLGMALAENKRIINGKVLGTGFYNAWISMCTGDNPRPNAFTRQLSNNAVLSVPVAHAQGRFVMPLELLQEIIQEGLDVFRYCDEAGENSEHFPVNPNGSMHQLAAVMNKAGNVMAMMPHPERTVNGDAIFLSMKDYLLDVEKCKPALLNYTPKPMPINPYVKQPTSYELLVQLIITDNEALSVQNTLHQLGVQITVSRLVHWQVDCDNSETMADIKKTGVLFNEKKEYLLPDDKTDLKAFDCAYLVRPKDDILGLNKQQMLTDHCDIEGIQAIHHGVLWLFKIQELNTKEALETLLATHILFNPNSHDCYEYK